MLARIEEFYRTLYSEILPGYKAAAGILSVFVLERSLIAYNEITIVSLWDSEEAALDHANSERVRTRLVKEFGIIQKDPFNFHVVSTWSSQDPTPSSADG